MSSYNLPDGAPTDTRFAAFLKSIALFNVYSQHCEDAILEAIFERIGTENKWCFECGAAEGLFFSNTKRLIDRGWNAILIECDGSDYERLTRRYAGTEHVHCMQRFLVAQPQSAAEITIDDALQHFDAPPDIDLLVLDIDSQEYFLVNSMTRFKPRALVVEYDPTAEPMFIPELRGAGQAGMMAMRYVCEARGYEVICKTPTNLICVRKDLAHLLMTRKAEVEKPQDHCPHGLPMRSRSGFTLKARCGCCNSTEKVSGNYCEACRTRAEEEQQRRLAQPVKHQVFAAGRWQDCDAEQIEVLPEEMDDAQAGKLPARAIVSEGKRQARIALCMSVPRQGYLDCFDALATLASHAGVARFTGWGVFWSHALTRSIQNALAWHDPATGDGFDFILTADYDTFATVEDLKALAELLVRSPEADCLVPLQAKRGGTMEILAGFESANMALEAVPIKNGHFGFTLFRPEFFERLAKPWFLEKPDENGDWGAGRTDPDMYFWKNAEECGLRAYLAPGIVIGHGEEVVTYPVIQDGAISKRYQPVNDWLATKQKPEGIGVV